MKSYNDRDCQPLPKKYTNKELEQLEYIWDKKLKKDGFQDIEQWISTTKVKRKRQCRIKFIRGHIRWFTFKNKEKFLAATAEISDFFRVVGLFAHHAPETLLPTKYRKILQGYAVVGSVSLATKQAKSKVPCASTYAYISRSLPTITSFVEELCEYERQ